MQIPFSEFLLTNMGYVQNEQTLLHSGQIVNFALLLADRVPGPFRHATSHHMTTT